MHRHIGGDASIAEHMPMTTTVSDPCESRSCDAVAGTSPGCLLGSRYWGWTGCRRTADMRRPSVAIRAVRPWCSVGQRAASRERSAVAERLQDPGGGRPKPGVAGSAALASASWRCGGSCGATAPFGCPSSPRIHPCGRGRRRAGEQDGGGTAAGREPTTDRLHDLGARESRGGACAHSSVSPSSRAHQYGGWSRHAARFETCQTLPGGGGIGMTAQPDQTKH
jgi:hypothetical protein